MVGLDQRYAGRDDRDQPELASMRITHRYEKQHIEGLTLLVYGE